MLFLDGVYIGGSYDQPMRFRQVKAPNNDELSQLTHTIAHRVARYLERQGLLERDSGNIYLTPEAMEVSDEDPSNQLLGSSITYGIVVGPQHGRKVMTLQTLPDCGDDQFTIRVGNVAGFSLHAGVAARAHERNKLERLCRYIAKRGRGKTVNALNDQTPAEKRAWPRPASRPVPGLTFSMTWAKRLKRVFNIDKVN